MAIRGVGGGGGGDDDEEEALGKHLTMGPMSTATEDDSCGDA